MSFRLSPPFPSAARRRARPAPGTWESDEGWFVKLCTYMAVFGFLIWAAVGFPGCIKADIEPRLLTAEAKLGDLSGRVGTIESTVSATAHDVSGIKGGTNDNVTTWLLGAAVILSVISYPIQRIVRLRFWPPKQ